MHDHLLTQLGSALVHGSLTDEAVLTETAAHPVLIGVRETAMGCRPLPLPWHRHSETARRRA